MLGETREAITDKGNEKQITFPPHVFLRIKQLPYNCVQIRFKNVENGVLHKNTKTFLSKDQSQSQSQKCIHNIKKFTCVKEIKRLSLYKLSPKRKTEQKNSSLIVSIVNK